MAEIIADTERLRLRNWGEKDASRFYEVMNTPAVMRWLGGCQSFDAWNAGYPRLLGYDRDFGFTFWIVERKSDDAILGFCGLKRANAPGAEEIAGEVEIGWRLRMMPGGRAMPRKRPSPRSISPSIVSRHRAWSRSPRSATFRARA